MIAVILVFIVILYALSGRASLLIGLAIPSSFLIGILMLALMGYTINMIVLFSLILAVGMLVDDAIIVTEFAERRMTEGMPKEEAFALAAKRMAGPVIAATMTRIAAFSPLLFWPGIVGDFMKYMPITLIVDAVGLDALRAGLHADARRDLRQGAAASRGRQSRRLVHGHRQAGGALPDHRAGADRRAAGRRRLRLCRNTAPASSSSPMSSPTTACSTCMRAAIFRWPKWMRRRRSAEDRLLGWPGIKSVYTRVGKTQGGGQDVPEDVVGVIQYEFVDWRERKSANQILDDLRGVMAGIPGVDVEVRVPEAGPPTGKPIQVRLSAVDPDGLERQGPRGRGAHCQGARRHRHFRRPAAARRRLGARGRPRQGGAVRHQPDLGRNRGAARDQRAEAHRIPAGRRRRRRRHPAAPAGGPAHAVDARRAAGADRARLGADLELRRRASPSRRSASSTASTAQRTVVVQANVAAGAQVAAVQQEVTQGRRRHGSRQRHPLEAGRLERGQRRSQRLPRQGLRRGDLPDLPRAAGAVQQVHQRAGWCCPAWSWRRSACSSGCC